ncbi:hypothetical protein QCB44_09020 [Thiomicrorhabdus sp. zzn3]|uniref:hypothetical protein n=1 Tax=Thiomicrorhabdus sp. zzn3 TaxID=3039775 RepID=UPI002436A065|nr:hypothetical protein [Thiomicrorhabdus sp. zzn3]MDG6778846.1 hypothetical protein [Thiomicrorhabdus sp. zzn3]
MELGSPEHKQILINGILKVALKTATIGLVIGLILLIPAFVRENAFSSGLAYAGFIVIIGSLGWALWLAWHKYQKIVKPFDQHFNNR